MHLASPEVKADVSQCMHASESLGEALDHEQFGGLIKVGGGQCSLSSEARAPLIRVPGAGGCKTTLAGARYSFLLIAAAVNLGPLVANWALVLVLRYYGDKRVTVYANGNRYGTTCEGRIFMNGGLAGRVKLGDRLGKALTPTLIAWQLPPMGEAPWEKKQGGCSSSVFASVLPSRTLTAVCMARTESQAGLAIMKPDAPLSVARATKLWL